MSSGRLSDISSLGIRPVSLVCYQNKFVDKTTKYHIFQNLTENDYHETNMWCSCWIIKFDFQIPVKEGSALCHTGLFPMEGAGGKTSLFTGSMLE